MGNNIICENNCHCGILGQNDKTDNDISKLLSNHVPSSKKTTDEYNLSPDSKDNIDDDLSVGSLQINEVCLKIDNVNENRPKKVNFNKKVIINNKDLQKASNQDTKDLKDIDNQEKHLHTIESDYKMEEKSLSEESDKITQILSFTIFKFNDDIRNLICLENKFYKNLKDFQFPIEEYKGEDIYNSLKKALRYDSNFTTKSDGKTLNCGYSQNNEFYGKGIEVDLETKKISEGVYLNNEIQIFGRIIEDNGIIYEGEIKESEKHGKGKQIDLVNNTKYTGEFKNNQRDGFGHFEFKSGYYSGFFIQDKMTGKGYIENDEFSYVGFFIDGLMNGFGEKKYKDNRCYKGNFKNGKFEGQGQFRWPDGRVYIGNYKNDMKHGEGCLKNNEDHTQVLGEWSKGRLVKILKNELL